MNVQRELRFNISGSSTLVHVRTVSPLDPNEVDPLCVKYATDTSARIRARLAIGSAVAARVSLSTVVAHQNASRNCTALTFYHRFVFVTGNGASRTRYSSRRRAGGLRPPYNANIPRRRWIASGASIKSGFQRTSPWCGGRHRRRRAKNVPTIAARRLCLSSGHGGTHDTPSHT